ncbi:hypothetical protein B0H21DRAFT_88179 [Amylocystis lapponica]|nr:hypothetical protein B0H21DRAFT_88179 [Amylocystis lapponica]
MSSESQDIEQATTAIAAQPDSKTRRYDRQLRLWAASGQSALESSRILVVSATATATAVLKNLVLPGIGHFALLDPADATPADAGNNFFLRGPASIGRPRAQEAVPLLRELNESVSGEAVLDDLHARLASADGRHWLAGFSLVIAHNVPRSAADALARFLWDDTARPPLLVVRSAGFLAEFAIQFHEHCVSEPHTDEVPPSLRITRPFPELLQWARDLDFAKMDPTEHSHVPFVVILVRAVEDWRNQHGGALPQGLPEQRAFKATLRALQLKPDEENFDEAEAQAWRVWQDPAVPRDIAALFDLPTLAGPPTNPAFHALLGALAAFTTDLHGPGCLPLAGALPDVHTDTASYVRLQGVYKRQAALEKARFEALLAETSPDVAAVLPADELDTFVRNAHHVRVLRGRRWGALDEDGAALASLLATAPRETATHLALSALSILLAQDADASAVTPEALTKEVQALVGADVELPSEVEDAVGEIARAPTADLPNTAAFLGGLVAQEAIKLITRQYVPVAGICVVDLVDMWTGVVGA